MEPKLLLGALLFAAVLVATLAAVLRGSSRDGHAAEAPLVAGVGAGPGVIQAAIHPSRPPALPTARPRAPAADTRPPGDDPIVDVAASAAEAERAARLAELEAENQALRFQLAEAERRLAAAAARQVTDFLGGVRACLDEGFGPDDFVLVAGGKRIDLRQDMQSVLFDVARHLRTQDLGTLRRVADDGRLRQVLVTLDVFHRRRLVDGIEDWGARKRQLNAIFALPIYPGV